MKSKVTVGLLVLAGVTLVWADKRPTFRFKRSAESDEGDSNYSFSWEMNDDIYENTGSHENHYGHHESHHGHRTDGSYFMDLPNGRKMTVTYNENGDSGFVPKVKFEGSAEYDSGESGENDSRGNYSR